VESPLITLPGASKTEKGTLNIQDTFLNYCRKESVYLLVWLVNGTHLKGVVKGFDNFTLLVESQGKMQVVYKHAVASMTPLQPVPDIWAQAQATGQRPAKAY